MKPLLPSRRIPWMRLSPLRARVATFLVAALAIPAVLRAQELQFPTATDEAALRVAMPALARSALAQYRGPDRDTHLNTTFRLQMVAGEHAAALETLAELRTLRAARDPRFARIEYSQYEAFARAALRRTPSDSVAFAAALRSAFLELDAAMDDASAFRAAQTFTGFDLDVSAAQLARALAATRDPSRRNLDEAVRLSRSYHTDLVYRALLPALPSALHEAEVRRYEITEAARVPLRDGNALTAVVVRPRRLAGPQPTVLELTIYANSSNRWLALEAASQGFVGVVATTRGKRGSSGAVIPFEPDAVDAYDLLEWISGQPWSNGAVGMIGGSYSGFTQWAAAKTRHPALRTIVPTAAVAPGIDFPRENGIVLSFQYAWSRYVGSNALLDEASFGDAARWSRIDSTWFAQGSAYLDLDVIDGSPNALWRRWLDHPTYDEYWQAMTPTAAEYERIDIPVLSITGYFDGAQPGALHYYRAHLANNPTANHTLLIGPWDHFGAQRRPSAVLQGLRIDPVANVDVIGVVYEWMAHVLRGAARPALLSDRVNFQVHGSNAWRHTPSLAAMSTDTLSLFLRPRIGGEDHRLVVSEGRSDADDSVVGTLDVDMKDRTQVSATFIAPGADTVLDRTNGLVFVSEPLAVATTLSGAFTGSLSIQLNVRDVDLAVELYERTADGEYAQLSYHLGRASLARDPERRTLLVPGATEHIPITGARVSSRVLEAGSQLVAVVRVNKNPQSQLNYGSGKDPSDETVADAPQMLQVRVLGGSRLRVPVLR